MNIQATWSIVAVCQDARARDWAVDFCDSLIQRFCDRFEFTISWWKFAQMHDPAFARKALRANLLVIAVHSNSELPLKVKSWLEQWLSRRSECEGAIVALAGPGLSRIARLPEETEIYLRNVAHRGKLDFLTQVPPDLSGLIPESIDWCSDRAQQMTALLEEILQAPASPPHCGN